MNRYLLLILLSSWAHVVPLSFQCETGVAYPNHLLSVPRSLMNNADVGLLKTYHAETLDKCITDCCAEKYGACTVASFKKNATDGNCQHFNCRPVEKCKFLSSSTTDSFSFTSSLSPRILVPSSNASKEKSSSSTVSTVTTNKPRLDKLSHSEQEHGVTKEALATYSEEQLAFKDDNTTIKPRKGVEDVTENSFENVSRSGIKPRKGVNLDGVINSDNIKSKVKPRKGVGPYQSQYLPSSSVTVTAQPTAYSTSSSIVIEHSSKSLVTHTDKDISDDLESALKKVFEDDTKVKDTKPSTTLSAESAVNTVRPVLTTAHYFNPTTVATVHSTSSVDRTTSSVLQSSLSTNYVASSSVQTPDLATTTFHTADAVTQTPMPSSSSPTILEHSKILFHEIVLGDGTNYRQSSESESSVESENERKYKSSMHLVLSLVFGLLVLFSVLGVVAKRVYDGWMRRHYRRMDFLIDGMYNGYG